MRYYWILGAFVALMITPEMTWAQPARQMPGTRPFLPSTPPNNFPPANSRVRAAPSATGQESTDFYTKNGYPKVLGDAVEQGNAQGQAGGAAGGGLAGGGGGLAGGGLGGGVGGGLAGGGGGGAIGFRSFQTNTTLSPSGLTGGGFSGVVPKGFGFGGAPAHFNQSWFAPMHGVTVP
ncbi:MAG: hypothetical protein JNJ77_13755 [Planctomycetia bacterium]|nr:hypothetical protein [Planctomycetia bacterium]